ncbi:MAG: hypothetical protein ACXVCY_18725 [Pseudobdellovibrionaceae bacterium]
MKFLILLIGLFSLSANALEFSGIWKGVGSMETSTWGKLPKCEVTVEITKTTTKLDFKDNWSFVKDKNYWSVGSGTELEIHFNELWNKDFRVGEIGDDFISVKYGNSDFSIDSKVQVDSSGRLIYTYSSFDSHGGYIKQSAVLSR